MIAASRLRPWPVPSTGQPFRGSREPCEPYGAAASAAYGASSKSWIAWCAAAGGLARGGLPRAVATAARPAEVNDEVERLRELARVPDPGGLPWALLGGLLPATVLYPAQPRGEQLRLVRASDDSAGRSLLRRAAVAS
eukprot:g29415.t1